MAGLPNWLIYALLSAIFAALTAVFAKAGLKDVNSDLATAIRTVVILLITWSIVWWRGSGSGWRNLTRYNWLEYCVHYFPVISLFGRAVDAKGIACCCYDLWGDAGACMEIA